jgi:hypothetical protein
MRCDNASFCLSLEFVVWPANRASICFPIFLGPALPSQPANALMSIGSWLRCARSFCPRRAISSQPGQVSSGQSTRRLPKQSVRAWVSSSSVAWPLRVQCSALPIGVLGLSADVDQSVDRAGTAENLSSWGDNLAVVTFRLWLGRVNPIESVIAEKLAIAEWTTTTKRRAS